MNRKRILFDLPDARRNARVCREKRKKNVLADSFDRLIKIGN